LAGGGKIPSTLRRPIYIGLLSDPGQVPEQFCAAKLVEGWASKEMNKKKQLALNGKRHACKKIKGLFDASMTAADGNKGE